MAKAEIRMTEGPIGKQLVSFAVPLFLGFLFQQLYNTADALIVGNMLGNSALAAVTGTGTLIFLLVGLGFRPLYAAGLCLIVNTAPVAFGAMGIPVIVAGQVLAQGTLDEVRGGSTLEERFLELSSSGGDVEGLEWLHTFSD